MAGQPTQPAKDILMLIVPCYHNFVRIIETVELAQHLSYIFITLPCHTVNFEQILSNNSVVEEFKVCIVLL